MRAKILANPAISSMHLEDLLIPLDENATSAQKKTVQMLLNQAIQRLKQQKNLETVAHQLTTQGVEVSVNDLGDRTAADLPSIFLPALSHAQAGQIVGPISAPNGYHFLKIVSIQSHTQQLTKEQLYQLAYEQKMQGAVEKWVQSLRKTAYIQINE